MKKEALLHFGAYIVFFVIYSLLHGAWNLEPIIVVSFFMGGIFGTLIPDLDHVLYVYFLRPEEYVSLRTKRMIKKGEVVEAINFLSEHREKRSVLVLHSLYFLVTIVFLSLVLLSGA